MEEVLPDLPWDPTKGTIGAKGLKVEFLVTLNFSLITDFFLSQSTQSSPRACTSNQPEIWVQGPDLNRGPSGYEPDELPDCSTLQLERG